MNHLEGLTRNLIKKGYSKEEILERIVQEYQGFKEIDEDSLLNYAKAILEECQKSDISSVSDPFIRELLDINNANIMVGKQGVGCRGSGDFFCP